MGGRGASSGLSDKQNEYGSQYHTILTSGNIKFISKNVRESETLMETMTQGRVYVTVGGTDLLSIVYFDRQNKRVKQIDLSHPHAGMEVHTHHGYKHNENDGKKGAAKPTPEEMRMVARVREIWYNHLSK